MLFCRRSLNTFSDKARLFQVNTSRCSCENESITNHMAFGHFPRFSKSVSARKTWCDYIYRISNSLFRWSIILWYVINRTAEILSHMMLVLLRHFHLHVWLIHEYTLKWNGSSQLCGRLQRWWLFKRSTLPCKHKAFFLLTQTMRIIAHHVTTEVVGLRAQMSK